MAKRSATNARVDHYIFSHTAGSKKKISIEPMHMRGGIRLWAN